MKPSEKITVTVDGVEKWEGTYRALLWQVFCRKLRRTLGLDWLARWWGKRP